MHSDVAETSGQCDCSCRVQGAALFRRSGQYCKGKIVVFFYVAVVIEECWGNKNPVFSLKFPAYYITALDFSCTTCPFQPEKKTAPPAVVSGITALTVQFQQLDLQCAVGVKMWGLTEIGTSAWGDCIHNKFLYIYIRDSRWIIN